MEKYCCNVVCDAPTNDKVKGAELRDDILGLVQLAIRRQVCAFHYGSAYVPFSAL